MATTAQTAANIANAQHSTGPRSDEGKQRAAANSTKHGLSSAFTVLSYENRAEFEQLIEDLTAEFNAETEHEQFLVAQMAQAQWRIARVDRIENATLEQMMESGDPTLDADTRIAAHLLDKGAAVLSAFQRYRTAAQNSYIKCCKLLADSIADRIAHLTVARIDQSISRRINAPLPAGPAQPKPGPRFHVAPGENLALRL